uniref:C-type lectin domain-containing protein n=1 Tax=Panagrellus redivivus TaxID=6233 RepID=A0A7E4V414_PANRE
MRSAVTAFLWAFFVVSIVNCEEFEERSLDFDGKPFPCATNATLTIQAAICPEVLSDVNQWYLSDNYKKIPRCFGIQPIPATLKNPEELVEVCTSKHPDARPASIHSDDDINSLHFRSMSGSLTGLYIPTSRPFAATNLKNFDDTPVDYTPICFPGVNNNSNVFALRGGTNPLQLEPKNFQEYIAKGTANVICALDATPRLPKYYQYPPKPILNISNYACEGDGWQLVAPCGGTPHCYQLLHLGRVGNFKDFFAEFNNCGMFLPNSYPASVQCEMEQVYLQTFTSAPVGIGLYTPHRAWPRLYGNWLYSDGSPFWWGRGNPGEPNNQAGNEFNVWLSPNMRDDPPQYGSYAICKKRSIPKTGPLPVPKQDTFTYKGKVCRKEKPSHWNHRCPTGHDDWIIIESPNGVFCFAVVVPELQLTPYNFNDKLCKKLHKRAKLASFHHDIQLGVATSFFGSDFIVGFVYKNNQYQWSDGSPVNETFWAPDEPKLNSSNAVAMLKTIGYPVSGAKNIDAHTYTFTRGALQTFLIDTLQSNPRVACKIDAEPVTPCAPLIEYKPQKTLNNTYCDADWIKQRFCGNVFCYKRYDIPGGLQTFKNAIEDDFCKTVAPGSHLASIHCVEEHYFVQTFNENTHIGLYIPEDHDYDAKNFRWTDGTPVDFVGWNRFSEAPNPTRQEPMKKQPDGPSSKAVQNKYLDRMSGWSVKGRNDFKAGLCKKEAQQYT